MSGNKFTTIHKNELKYDVANLKLKGSYGFALDHFVHLLLRSIQQNNNASPSLDGSKCDQINESKLVLIFLNMCQDKSRDQI